MIKKVIIAVAATAFMFCGIASFSSAADMGPEEMTLEATNSKKPKPAFFPHKVHQDAFACADCHHGMSEDGAQVPYVDGQEIGKCESCHNAEKLAGKKSGKNKLDTYKGAAHANCVTCHKEEGKKDPAKKALGKCSTCHKK